MDNHFICPHCRSHLKVGEKIIFRIKNKKNRCGLLLLHPQIGNYSSVKHPDFEFEQGEALCFYCPLCDHNLMADFDEHLIYVIMVNPSGRESDIYFSRIAGERSTYQVEGDTVTATGEDSGKYTYFRMSDNFKRFLKK